MADVIRNQRLLARELAEVARLWKEVKERGRVFDVAEKEAAAKDAGLPADAYYAMPFKSWEKVKRAYHGSLEEQARKAKAVAAFHGIPVKKLRKLPLNEWRDLYWQWKRK